VVLHAKSLEKSPPWGYPGCLFLKTNNGPDDDDERPEDDLPFPIWSRPWYVSKFWSLNFNQFTCSTIWCEDESTWINMIQLTNMMLVSLKTTCAQFTISRGYWTTPGLVGDTGKRECPTWTFPEAKVDGWKFGITRLDCMKWFSSVDLLSMFYSEMAINECFWMEIMVFAFQIHWFGWISNGFHGEHKTHTCKNRCGAWKETPFFANRQVQFPREFFGELFLLFRHLEGAYIPQGHAKKPVFFAVKLVWNGWLLNPKFCEKILPTKIPTWLVK